METKRLKLELKSEFKDIFELNNYAREEIIMKHLAVDNEDLVARAINDTYNPHTPLVDEAILRALLTLQNMVSYNNAMQDQQIVLLDAILEAIKPSNKELFKVLHRETVKMDDQRAVIMTENGTREVEPR